MRNCSTSSTKGLIYRKVPSCVLLLSFPLLSSIDTFFLFCHLSGAKESDSSTVNYLIQKKHKVFQYFNGVVLLIIAFRLISFGGSFLKLINKQLHTPPHPKGIGFEIAELESRKHRVPSAPSVPLASCSLLSAVSPSMFSILPFCSLLFLKLFFIK